MVEQQQSSIGRFFRFLGRAIRNYFITIGVLVTIAYVLVIVSIVSMQHRAESKHGKTLSLSKDHPSPLVLNLTGKIAERQPDLSERLLAHFFKQEKEIYLPELRTALRHAAKDQRIAKLVVRLGQLGGSPADYTELRRLLADFKAGGKGIEAALPVADDWPYYVASVADRITLDPASEVMITGPSFHLMYFGDALKKIGVDIDVVRAGKYKSAFEPFVLNAPSPAALEEYQTMQQSLMEHIVTLVAQGRKKDKEVVRGWYRRSVFTTDEAKTLGMVDAIGYPPDIDTDEDDDSGKGKGPGSPVALDDYLGDMGEDSAESVSNKGGIALIEAVGEINMDSGGRSSEDSITPSEMHRQLRWATNEDDVKAVVFRVSSPGGSALASDLIWHDVKELADKKPVVVSMGAYAASGGYYISTPAKYIVADPTTITGSIGVIGMLPSIKPFQEKYGVSFYIVSSSDRREMMNFGSHATPEDKALMEKTIDQVYKGFLQRVSDGRKLPLAQVEALAQGRVYSGVQGKALGLVDELGGLQDAFKQAKKLAGFDPEKLYPVLQYEGGGMTLSQCLKSPAKIAKCLGQAGSTAPSLNVESAEATAAHLTGWVANARQDRVLALWPGYLGASWQ